MRKVAPVGVVPRSGGRGRCGRGGRWVDEEARHVPDSVSFSGQDDSPADVPLRFIPSIVMVCGR